MQLRFLKVETLLNNAFKANGQWIVLVCGENQMKLFFFIES